MLVAVLKPQPDVLGKALAFLLGKRGHDGEQDFAFGIQRVDSLFLEENGDVLVLQLPDVFQAVEGVPGKAADRLGNHHVDPACHAVVDQAIELFTLLRISAGNAVVGVNTCQFPAGMLTNVIGVMLDLGLVAGCLFIRIRRNPAVGCHPNLTRLTFVFSASASGSGGNHSYSCHFKPRFRSGCKDTVLVHRDR